MTESASKGDQHDYCTDHRLHRGVRRHRAGDRRTSRRGRGPRCPVARPDRTPSPGPPGQAATVHDLRSAAAGGRLTGLRFVGVVDISRAVVRSPRASAPGASRDPAFLGAGVIACALHNCRVAEPSVAGERRNPQRSLIAGANRQDFLE